MHFKSISLSEWRQFLDIQIEFHPRLTVITGPNGSGKSTLLSLLDLSIQSVHREPFMATPVNDEKSGKSGFSLGTLFARYNPFRRPLQSADHNIKHTIGSVVYSSDEKAILEISDLGALQYDMKLTGQKPVAGFKIGSHRALPRYQAIATLPISGIKPREAFEFFARFQSNYLRGGHLQHNGKFVENPVAALKETLIGFAAFGTSNTHMKAIPELVGLYDGFQEVLKKVLPTEIGFQKLEVRGSEVVVVSRTGEFPIDSASGGLMSIIQTAWQIFLFVKAYGREAVVLIDEPENHLHPSLQRDFLSNLVSTFEHVQFIIATHSPFIISSVKDSTIYALRYAKLKDSNAAQSSAVTAQMIDLESKAGSASKILDEVLGVSVTIPIWAENELDKIAEQFETSKLSQQSIDRLREDLASAGLAEFFPEAVGKILRD